MYSNETNVKPRILHIELSFQLTGMCFKAHNHLGQFCRERQYGDALAIELSGAGISFKRERPVEVAGRKSSFVDFVIEDKIAVELKAKSFIEKEDYYQIQRYLRSAKLELGVLVNFAQPHLKPKRVLNPDMQNNSEHSDGYILLEN